MQTWPTGFSRDTLESVDSTNAEVLRRAAAGATGPLWVLARRQTAARGRRGRAWASPHGNFAATLLIRPPGALAQRSFVAALGLYDALVAVTGRPALFALKWPNDVLLEGRKLAGILLESGPNGTLAVGIGVNLAVAPDPAGLEPGAVPPASLRGATGLAIAPEDFLDHLAPAVQAREEDLLAFGFPALRDAWLARATRLGEEIVARLPGRAVSGRFETVDDTGALVLATATGRIALPAAEVHFAAEDAPDAAGH